MVVLKYLLSIFLAYIVSMGSVMLLIVIRCGIPTCNNMLNNNTLDVLEKEALIMLKKQYIVSIIIWTSNIIITTILVLLLFENTFKLYICLLFAIIIVNFNRTGTNSNNLSDFWNSYQKNINILKQKSKKI